ncbi:PaaI family thioesterase [Cohnella ginsengisoli]|uniref:PaaI family thioesterase n=1 Tax=Cohnella ginsengisoli TaxID=425004 RepID=A0A9X4KJ56_9BACL|nr:PaaI family thioesterase [Cohnella ginsengisoli]MDG0793167.1 PaaI family thioesterase [Cohnella ginsengisoli]
MEGPNPSSGSDSEMVERARRTFWGYLGCELIRRDARETVVELDVEERHMNLIGMMHGGVHTALLDSAMGLAAMAARPDEDVVTSSLNIHFTAPARAGRVRATATVVHMSGRMVTAEGRLYTADGKLSSMATASFRVLDRKS